MITFIFNSTLLF